MNFNARASVSALCNPYQLKMIIHSSVHNLITFYLYDGVQWCRLEVRLRGLIWFGRNCSLEYSGMFVVLKQNIGN